MRRNLFYIFLGVLLSALVTGCSDTTGTASGGVFFGGQIINPTSDFLLIKKNNKTIDTIFLGDNGIFRYNLEDVERGAYLIEHEPETQNLFLVPGDSILMRVNTYDFDGSLHFSGVGDEKNNLLVDMFLADKKNNGLILEYYNYEPNVFAKKTDSIRNERLDNLEELHKKNRFPKDFLELTRNIIRYENYDLKERYTYLLNKYYQEYYQKIPTDFHSYREDVNFDEGSLQTNPGYIRFIENYLINQSISNCTEENPGDYSCYNLNDNKNILNRIKLIDSLTDLPLVKNHFFSKLGALGIVMAKEKNEITAILELLSSKGYSEQKFQDLKQLGRIQLAFLPGVKIDHIPLINTSEEKVPFNKVISKPTVLFIWSIYSPSRHKRDHKKIRELRKKYPEVNFLGINVDIGETSQWQQAISKNGYDKNSEFQLTETKIKNELFRNYANKLLLLDASGEVVIGDAYLNSPEFETEILELLNQ